MARWTKVSAIVGGIAAAGTIATAWVQLDLWRPASAAEMEQLKDFSIETRMMILEDNVWEMKAQLRDVKRQIRQAETNGEPVPDYLRRDRLELERRIDTLEADIQELEQRR